MRRKDFHHEIAGFPCTLENLENEKINFQAWKSPGNFFKNAYEDRIQYFWHDLYPPKAFFLPQIIALENLNFDLEKSWENAHEKVWEP